MDKHGSSLTLEITALKARCALRGWDAQKLLDRAATVAQTRPISLVEAIQHVEAEALRTFGSVMIGTDDHAKVAEHPETPPTAREAIDVIVAQAKAITAAEGALLDLLARSTALETERDEARSTAQVEAGLGDEARAEAKAYRDLLLWIEREASIYSEYGRAETSRRIRAVLQAHE